MRIAVLGAGVAGLVAALRLTRGRPHRRRLRALARAGRPGGDDRRRRQGHLLERYYHHLFSTDRHIAALYDELGMPDELEWIGRRASPISPRAASGRS